MIYFWAAIALLGIASVPVLVGLLIWEIGYWNWRKPSRGELKSFDRYWNWVHEHPCDFSPEAWIEECRR